MFSGDSLFNQMQDIANNIRNDVEKQLNQSFKQFDVLEHQALEDPEHTSYFMKVKTNDNGHVRVKTIKKKPGSDWKTHVEEYYRGSPAVEGEKSQEKKAVEGSQGEKMETENAGRREKLADVEIEEEQPKGSQQSQASTA